VALSEEATKKLPLGAFALLATGDVFEAVAGKAPPDGPAKAKAYAASHLRFNAHGASQAVLDRIVADVVRQLSGNLQLIARLSASRAIHVDVVPVGKSIAQYGYPRVVAKHAAGLFWDDPSWPNARMALRIEHLETTPQLVIHEMAHGIHYLAFTPSERDLIYKLLLRKFRSKAAIDEVFAIYSEREFVQGFTDHDHRAPGVYGYTRQQWSEDHVFTRFVRNLYFPYKKLAGPAGPAGPGPGGPSGFFG
jgi:hypothetical protein